MRKEGPVHLSAAEWTVMEVLWKEQGLSGREVSERMAPKTGWNRSTTLTHLRRMEEKGALTSEVSDVKRFYPAVGREESILQETESFLDRVYQGSVSLMVSALTKKQSLPQREIDELYAILDEAEGKTI